MAGEKVTKITRIYNGSTLDNSVPDTFPEIRIRDQTTAKFQQQQLHPFLPGSAAVSYTHLTLPTSSEV